MRLVGRYINRDSAADRRAAMHAQLQRLGLADSYRRFRAIEGASVKAAHSPLSPAELGRFMSHYHCIVETGDPDRHVHVMEDDAVLARQTAPLLEGIDDSLLETTDLVYTDLAVPLNMNALFNLVRFWRTTGMKAVLPAPADSRMPASISFLPLQSVAFAGSTSYVVNPLSRHKLRRLLDQALARGPDLPIDQLLRRFVADGQLQACCILPFLTSVERDPNAAQPALALHLMRDFFFVARDEAASAASARTLAGETADPHRTDPLEVVFRFLLSEEFTPF